MDDYSSVWIITYKFPRGGFGIEWYDADDSDQMKKDIHNHIVDCVNLLKYSDQSIPVPYEIPEEPLDKWVCRLIRRKELLPPCSVKMLKERYIQKERKKIRNTF